MAKASGPPFSSRIFRASSSTHDQNPPVRPCAICTLSARTPSTRRRPPSCEPAGLTAPASISPHIAADTPRRNADLRGETPSLVVPILPPVRGRCGRQGGTYRTPRQEQPHTESTESTVKTSTPLTPL